MLVYGIDLITINPAHAKLREVIDTALKMKKAQMNVFPGALLKGNKELGGKRRVHERCVFNLALKMRRSFMMKSSEIMRCSDLNSGYINDTLHVPTVGIPTQISMEQSHRLKANGNENKLFVCIALDGRRSEDFDRLANKSNSIFCIGTNRLLLQQTHFREDSY